MTAERRSAQFPVPSAQSVDELGTGHRALGTVSEFAAERIQLTATWSRKPGIIGWLSDTDHKTIGLMYLTASFTFFILGGVMAMLMRAELGRPGLQFLSPEQYNELFTMHGTIMLLLFATPLFVGFANELVPLQIGARDMAFPRLNALSFWLLLFGALVLYTGFVWGGGPADSAQAGED